MPTDFIARHDLWSADQRSAAADLHKMVRATEIDFVRVCWPDQHGVLRGKALTRETFLNSLVDGSEATMAPFFFDTANAIVFNPFVTGGGFDDPALSGSPNVVVVPDPQTFRMIPWSPGTGIVLGDLYMRDGSEFAYSPRHVLRHTLERLHAAGFGLTVGIELEWYLTRIVDERLVGNPGAPGAPAQPPAIAPVARGYSHLSVAHLDEVDAIVAPIGRALMDMGMPLRSIEDEWAPSQLEVTFDVLDALAAADTVLLSRAAIKQVCRRDGYLATFMCQPVLEGAFGSGWHLHSSLRDKNSGDNAMVSADDAVTSDIGLHYIGGTLEHAAAASAFTTPTINGYRRRRANSLAPDRVSWAVDNRAAMIRLVGAAGDTSTHVENRVGEPLANPYLYIAAQALSGIDGVTRRLDPGSPTDSPYLGDHSILPTSLADALDVLERDAYFGEALGHRFVNYIVAMKRSEVVRYEQWCADHPNVDPAVSTDWEQAEYLDL